MCRVKPNGEDNLTIRALGWEITESSPAFWECHPPMSFFTCHKAWNKIYHEPRDLALIGDNYANLRFKAPFYMFGQKNST
jgi:hypothetical protein